MTTYTPDESIIRAMAATLEQDFPGTIAEIVALRGTLPLADDFRERSLMTLEAVNKTILKTGIVPFDGSVEKGMFVVKFMKTVDLAWISETAQ